jgi:hypothetical protein
MGGAAEPGRVLQPGSSYLETADLLTDCIRARAKDDRPDLISDSPVRHLYAQTWELALKACLFALGVRPTKLKKDYGHNVLRVWKRVDKERFATLNLEPETELIAEHLGIYHSEKMFAYPLSGVRRYLPLNFLKEQSQRFRLSRLDVIRLFHSNPQDP